MWICPTLASASVVVMSASCLQSLVEPGGARGAADILALSVPRPGDRLPCRRRVAHRRPSREGSMTKSALITGVTGQDGSYLAELLLAKGYEVHGIVRRSSSFNTGRLDHIYQDPHEPGPRLHLHYGDLTDSVALVNLIRAIAPNEVYHLGA